MELCPQTRKQQLLELIKGPVMELQRCPHIKRFRARGAAGPTSGVSGPDVTGPGRTLSAGRDPQGRGSSESRAEGSAGVCVPSRPHLYQLAVCQAVVVLLLVSVLSVVTDL